MTQHINAMLYVWTIRDAQCGRWAENKLKLSPVWPKTEAPPAAGAAPKVNAEVSAGFAPKVNLDLRCKIRSYLTPNFSANFTDFRQLERARSRLYRSRFLQPNTHFAGFFEIYKIVIPLHRSRFNILANFHRKLFAIFKLSPNFLRFFTVFIEFCTDFDENFSEFCQIP